MNFFELLEKTEVEKWHQISGEPVSINMIIFSSYHRYLWLDTIHNPDLGAPYSNGSTISLLVRFLNEFSIRMVTIM